MKNKWIKAYQGPFTLREAREIVEELKPKMEKLQTEVKITKRRLKREYDIKLREIL
jgi:hypothetical protein